jgi:hypothetical protein
MLEPLMRRSRIHKGGKSQLVYVPKPLERPTIDHPSLVGPDSNEDVNRVAKFME